MAQIEALPGSVMAEIEPLPGSDAIGHSYDVFGFYANPKSVKRQLFNFASQQEITSERNTWLLSTDIVSTAVRDMEIQTVSLRTKDAYSRELSASVKVSGSYGGFSASVESDFSQSISEETDSTYTSVRTNVNKWKLSLKPTVEELRSMLTPSFKQALASMNTEELFTTYGTHYLSEVLVGGRADYVATTKTSAFSSDTQISVVAEVAFKSVAGMEVSAGYKELIKKFQENSSTRLYAIGGTALSNITDTATYNAWLTSIDTLPVFCGFTSASLKPIWELAASSQRREILQKATHTFIPLEIRRNAIIDVDIVVSDNDRVNPPYGFKKIDYDLNRGAKGKFIYLCYKQQKISVAGSPADPKPITALYVASGTEHYRPAIPVGYTWINVDLNEGAGGNYIYLCYTKDPDAIPSDEDGLPIRGIRVIGNPQVGNVVTPYGFTRINKDLNEGAKGEYIYVCFSRHLD